jgi:hypothetical protein
LTGEVENAKSVSAARLRELLRLVHELHALLGEVGGERVDVGGRVRAERDEVDALVPLPQPDDILLW